MKQLSFTLLEKLRGGSAGGGTQECNAASVAFTAATDHGLPVVFHLYPFYQCFT